VSILSVVGFFGLYNLTTVYVLLIWGVIFAHKEIIETLTAAFTHTFETGGYAHDILSLNTNKNLIKKFTPHWEARSNTWVILSLIHSFFFTVFAMIVSVNLVNIYRPFPIWWDDLGAYMNIPKLIANSQNTSEQWLIFWQVFTGIGFMHESATFAFYLNSFASILWFIAIWWASKYFLQLIEGSHAKWKVSFPLMFITLFASLPMIVFQQAKDMKLDSWLLAVLILGISMLFAWMHEKDEKMKMKFLFLAGWFTGIAFAIKLTSLMLVIGALWALWYYRGKILWLLAYFLLFIGVFTGWRLWGFMNVSYPKELPTELNIFAGISIITGISILFLCKNRSGNTDFYKFLLRDTLLFLVGFIIFFLPWLSKNIVEIYQNNKPLSVYSILGGIPKLYEPDYTKIHDAPSLESIQKKLENRDINNNWQIANEDFGRYFGYETGINNYLKLPYNLTVQANQSGEFTDIGYLFLALVPPAIFFFLRTSLGYILYSTYLLSLFLLFFSKWSGVQSMFTNLFGAISLPIGYLAIISFAFFPLFVIYIDERLWKKITESSSEWVSTQESMHTFTTLFVFITLYILLFVVSAFGIVWYGILAYFGFMLLFGVSYGKLFLINQSPSNENVIPHDFSKAQPYIISLLLCFILPYFGFTVIARAWNNIPSAQDNIEYKLGKYTEYEAVFLNRPEYITTLSAINLKDWKKLDSSIRNATTNTVLLALFQKYPEANLARTLSILDYAEWLGANEKTTEGITLVNEARRLKTLAYKWILYPEEGNKNDASIYRVGTFLSYYISENRKRFFEDSLIFAFEPYIKWDTPDKTAENLKKMGIKYLLLDLNAATIDRDPRKDLTRRYEQLLEFVRSDKVRLLATDSLCLQLWLELKKDPSYLTVAGTNYTSYMKDSNGKEKILSSQEKSLICLQNIVQIISEKRITEKNFTYLQNYANYLERNKITEKDAMMQALYPYIQRSWMGAFEIID
jgi:ABC-type multidrug transport system fused ATPase/permease subunit